MSSLLISSESANKVVLKFNDASANRLHSPDSTVGHVCVLGKARTGKSFLLNVLAGRNGVFQVGNEGTVTKGVHISEKSFSFDFKHDVRLIDVEGMGENGDDYDLSLALPVLATSDLILFNFKGQPRAKDVIKELELLIHIFERVIREKKNQKVLDEKRSKLFPTIILVLRDWTCSPAYTREKYLSEIFDEKDAKAQKILQCVAKIDVCFLPPPADHTLISRHSELPIRDLNDDFRKSLNGLKQQMMDYLSQPTGTLLSSPVRTSGVFLGAVKLICHQLNEDTLHIPSLVESIEAIELGTAVANVTDIIRRFTPLQLPTETCLLEIELDQRMKTAMSRFQGATMHLKNQASRQKEEDKLRNEILRQNRGVVNENQDIIEKELSRQSQVQLSEFRSQMLRLSGLNYDVNAVKREVAKQRERFISGLLDCARNKRFLRQTQSSVDESRARKLLPIEKYVSDFDLTATNEVKACEIEIERKRERERKQKIEEEQRLAAEFRRIAEQEERRKRELEEQAKKTLIVPFTGWAAFPLHRASYEGKTDVVNQLVLFQNYNVHSKDEYGQTPLEVARYRGHAGIVRLLEQCGTYYR